MSSGLKNFLKRFLPASAKASKGYADTVLWKLEGLEKRIDEISSESIRHREAAELTEKESYGNLLNHFQEFSDLLRSLYDVQREEIKAIDERTKRLEELLALALNDHKKGLKNEEELLSKATDAARSLTEIATSVETADWKIEGIMSSASAAVSRAEQGELLSRQMLDGIEKIGKDLSSPKEVARSLGNAVKDHSEAIGKKLESILNDISSISKETSQIEAIKSIGEIVLKKTDKINERSVKSVGNSAEAVWAHVFHDTVKDSEWLKDKSFSPGRWAVGYPCLYVLYRILNTVSPKAILDIGLGHTSNMISQYADYKGDVSHIIIENNENWINSFSRNVSLSDSSHIIKLDLELTDYKECQGIRTYKGFKETLENQKFDLIIVDAPYGGDMKKYSRIDILQIIPSSLSDNFIILVHDTERIPENNTVEEILGLLKSYNIEYQTGRYNGQSGTVMICAKNTNFLTTM